MPRRERLSPVQRSALVGIPMDREGPSRVGISAIADRCYWKR